MTRRPPPLLRRDRVACEAATFDQGDAVPSPVDVPVVGDAAEGLEVVGILRPVPVVPGEQLERDEIADLRDDRSAHVAQRLSRRCSRLETANANRPECARRIRPAAGAADSPTSP